MKAYKIYASLIYTDAPPHIGHLYELITANALCESIKTWYSAKLAIGTDDHGTKILSASKTKNTKPIKVSNLNCNKLLALCSKYKLNVKDWTSTCHPRHIKLIKRRLQQINKTGAIYESSYCGWYSPQSDCYYSSNDTQFLVNLMYCVNSVPVEWTEERAVFIKLSSIKHRLRAIHRAKIITTPYIDNSSALETVNIMEDICITRQRGYGLKLTTLASTLVLWVWVDALLAYTKTNKEHKIHIIGKDILKFHLTHYIIYTLSTNNKLPKTILQHAYIKTLQTKISKSLKNQPNTNAIETNTLYYYLCTRAIKADIELTKLELTATLTKITNNVGNLTKRLSKLLSVKHTKLQRITVSEWVIISYTSRLPSTFSQLVKSFKLNELNNIILNGTTKVNKAISNYKLWSCVRAAHKLVIYAFATKQHVKQLKFALGNKTKSIVLNIVNANTKYTPWTTSLSSSDAH